MMISITELLYVRVQVMLSNCKQFDLSLHLIFKQFL